MAGKKFLEKRMPMYFGGLLLGLGAMVAIFQMKRAMMPKFHELKEERAEAVITPGGGVRFVYPDDPGYFLIPGLPTNAVIFQHHADGKSTTLVRAQYGNLVEKDPLLGPLTEEGKYSLDADFYICAGPGAPDCTKYTVTQDIRVEREAPAGESRIEIDLAKLAQDGVNAGGNKATAGDEEKPEQPPKP